MAAPSSTADPPRTPDGRYIVHRGKAGPRLWRATRPDLPAAEAARLRTALGRARSAVRVATDAEAEAEAAARAAVDAAKRALGERGPVWWTDGTPDLNRRLVRNTTYADWWAARVEDGA